MQPGTVHLDGAAKYSEQHFVSQDPAPFLKEHTYKHQRASKNCPARVSSEQTEQPYPLQKGKKTFFLN